MIKQILFAGIATLTLSACETMFSQLESVGKEPELASVQAPMKKVDYEPVRWPENESTKPVNASLANSLWQPGNRMFFKDQRARRIGDILKVTISIADKAELDNTSERSRDNSRNAGVTSLFGLEGLATGWLPGKADPASLIDATTSSSHKGEGTIEREEKIETEVAAMVTQILPNGNLVIQGDQEVRVNFELRKITVSGIVRPEDISAENSVDSNLIAEARISYGGRGQITEMQQPPIGHQIVDAISPF